MSVTIKGNRRVKREMVIPFEGEEMLVVPKRGGFGQPDMEGYVMASGVRSTGLETNTSTTLDTNTDTTSGGASSTIQTGVGGITLPMGSSADVPPPSGTTSTSTSSDGAGTIGGGIAVGSGTNAGDVPTGNQTQTGTTTILQASTDVETGINSTLQTGSGSGGVIIGGITSGDIGAGSNTGSNTTTGGNTTDTEIPLFPDLTNMNCTELKSEITRLKSKIATTVFTTTIANAYNNQLTLATNTETTKCTRVLPTETLLLTPLNTNTGVGGGGGGGGFGGGGGGYAPEEPIAEEVAPDESGKRIGIILVLALIGGLYFLTRKSN